MKSEDFITTASQIVGFGEAGSRSATSRAYYGAFHFAKEVICDVAGIEPARFGRSHKLPIYCLNKTGDDNALEAAYLLGNLQSRRIKADYKIKEPNPNKLAYGQYSVEQALECQRCLEVVS
ncbi:hypothetical protein Pan153_23550 [Gimesia panareensis]|uniref:HEPN domain-containing protein n=1 Tax=Gimesia panareensis TaxID=2527978 RepID=A0A518FMW8_9PLAN|nr:hypothetical protein [Gimesia panareensis]QDV17701.1 hypothetical protein Pan153_23550 [Gimesia panareensis]